MKVAHYNKICLPISETKKTCEIKNIVPAMSFFLLPSLTFSKIGPKLLIFSRPHQLERN